MCCCRFDVRTNTLRLKSTGQRDRRSVVYFGSQSDGGTRRLRHRQQKSITSLVDDDDYDNDDVEIRKVVVLLDCFVCVCVVAVVVHPTMAEIAANVVGAVWLTQIPVLLCACRLPSSLADNGRRTTNGGGWLGWTGGGSVDSGAFLSGHTQTHTPRYVFDFCARNAKR